jgi:hypothetical protein
MCTVRLFSSIANSTYSSVSQTVPTSKKSGDPVVVGIGRHTEDVHHAAVQLEHEQHVVATGERRVGREEVGG